MSDQANPAERKAESAVPPTVEAALEPVLKDLPEPKQNEIVRVIKEEFMAVFRGGGMTPQVDPETAKILAASIDKDNENKFKF